VAAWGGFPALVQGKREFLLAIFSLTTAVCFTDSLFQAESNQGKSTQKSHVVLWYGCCMNIVVV
jgi:hypothetical protein